MTTDAWSRRSPIVDHVDGDPNSARVDLQILTELAQDVTGRSTGYGQPPMVVMSADVLAAVACFARDLQGLLTSRLDNAQYAMSRARHGVVVTGSGVADVIGSTIDQVVRIQGTLDGWRGVVVVRSRTEPMGTATLTSPGVNDETMATKASDDAARADRCGHAEMGVSCDRESGHRGAHASDARSAVERLSRLLETECSLSQSTTAAMLKARAERDEARAELDRLRVEIAAMQKAAAPSASPIPMRLPCPDCGELHVDEGEFATKSHHTHSCQHCGLTWRPAVVATVGVRFLPGFRNETSNETCDGLTRGLIVRHCELPMGHTGEHGLRGGDGMSL